MAEIDFNYDFGSMMNRAKDWGITGPKGGPNLGGVLGNTQDLIPKVGVNLGGAGSGSSGWGFFNSKDGPGWGGTALDIAGGLGQAFMGMQNYGLQKDALNFSKDSFNRNFEAQKTTTNASLEDRQRARVASNPGAYESIGDYMRKNEVK